MTKESILFDQNVPSSLKKEQLWFGQIIGRPIDEDSKMDSISPTGQFMEIEAAEHIAPSPTLRPAQRIQIYNQQYWWRLLNTMHELYPLVTRLFGYREFNHTIAIPYLVKYPPRHWSLTFIGDRLAQWIEEEYHAKDKKLVYEAAVIDWSFTHSFISEEVPSLTADDLNKLQDNEIPLYTQSYVHLFSLESEMFRYREQFLKETPEHWMNNDFPVLDHSKPYHFVLHRNRQNNIAWREISAAEYNLLNLFKKGCSLDQACEWIEEQPEEIADTMMNNLQRWFQSWTEQHWLFLKP